MKQCAALLWFVLTISAFAQDKPASPTGTSSSRSRNSSTLPNAPSAAYQPLTDRQKFQLFWVEARNPLTFGGALVTAASWHAYGDPPFGGGGVGFAKSYAAAVGQRETGLLLTRWAVPVLLHQDPRYFPAPPGSSNVRRTTYAASRVFMTRADNGGQTWNGSYLLGGLASAAIANTYIRHRDAGRIAQDFAVNMGTDAGMNILKEFWPSLRPRIPGKKMKKIGDIVIGR